MALLEPPAEPSHKSRNLTYTIVALVLVAVIGLWYTFRFYPEKRVVQQFFAALVAGDMAQARDIWKPSPSYQMQDFLADWGTQGYYGPVKSYKIIRAHAPPGQSNNVVVEVAISPFSPMPVPSDPERSRKTRVVNLWVNSETKSLSFPPPYSGS